MAVRSPLIARLLRDFAWAGDLYYRRGQLEKAARMYARASLFDQAAKLYAELGHTDEAVEHYLRGGGYRQAAELLASSGDHQKAVAHFERAGAPFEAAQAALKLRQFARAARLFEQAGAFVRAAQCFEEGRDVPEALRMLAKEARRLDVRARERSDPEARKDLRRVDLERAGLLVKLGRLREAAEIHLRWGQRLEAAELLQRAEAFGPAVESYLAAEEPAKAYALLDRVPQLDAMVRAQVLLRAGHPVEAAESFLTAGRREQAAEAFEAGGEPARAATLWDELGQHERAAELYSQGSQWGHAASCFEKAQNYAAAAEAFLKVPDERAAARCFLRIERPLKAAQLFIRGGDLASASKILQAIPPDSPSFKRATPLLVPLLIQDGLFEGALHRLRMSPPDPSDTGTVAIELFYWEGRAQEALGALREAELAYEKVLALRREHRDAAARRDSVRRRRAALSGSQALGVADGVNATVRIPVPSERQEDLFGARYRVLSLLGRGGMGRVYKAHDLVLDDTVAIKALHTHGGEEGDEDRLLREVQICRKITHPNVVRVHDIGRFAGGVFVTMEYLEGSGLDKVLRSEAPLPLGRVKNLLSQLLAGLREAHQLKIVHRDLKPSNVFLCGDRVKILDFGIARFEEQDTDLTLTGEVVGSPKYMSPEQLQGRPLDGRSDLYSLGVMTFALLTGREPFEGSTASAIALRHLKEPPPDLNELRPELPPAWKALVERLLAKDPEDRPKSAAKAQEVVAKLPE